MTKLKATRLREGEGEGEGERKDERSVEECCVVRCCALE